tara:strand:+ start:139 stop:771 length:633 start_codon:yes stop_codon:yes gene_type:complete
MAMGKKKKLREKIYKESNRPVGHYLMPIDSLGLSNRINNSLKAYGIFYIADLVQFTSKQLLECVPNINKISIEEIEKVIFKHRFTFETKILIDPLLNEIIDNFHTHIVDSMKQRRESTLKYDPVLSRPIADTFMRDANIDTLHGEGIYTILDLVQRTENEILHIPSIGKKSLDDIKTILKQRGLSLGMSITQLVKMKDEERKDIIRKGSW